MPAKSLARDVLAVAWPIMLSYVAVGLACGVLEAKCGMAHWMAFLLSVTLISGAGQFMMSNLWLAGVPVPSIALSVAAISLRFALYSASLAPHLRRASRGQSLALSATLIEEAYGVTLGKLAGGTRSGWTLGHALALNVVTILTWALSCAAGAALGAAIDLPTAIAGFAMTSLFIYLVWTQPRTRGNAGAMAAAALTVIACKSLGLSAAAVPLAAVAGVAAGLAAAATRHAGSEGEAQ